MARMRIVLNYRRGGAYTYCEVEGLEPVTNALVAGEISRAFMLGNVTDRGFAEQTARACLKRYARYGTEINHREY